MCNRRSGEIDRNVIDLLLYEEEGDDLDFKRDQYRFLKASDEDKSELLKDIVSFANGWRRADAYILLGVKEVKGAKSELIGIKEQDKLDDAQLQQFVNQKTQRPIQFSYKHVEIEECCVGVIHIPIQQRPFYLKKDYGKLKRDTVYVRRGSSTAVAEIDEISKMGISYQVTDQVLCPELEFLFGDLDKREVLPDVVKIECLSLEVPRKKDVPDYVERRDPFDPTPSISMGTTNREYYRELVRYTAADRLYTSLNFAVKNTGNAVAVDVRVEIMIRDKEGVVKLLDEPGFPKEPQYSYFHFDVMNSQMNSIPEYDLRVKKMEDYWLVQAELEKVQPQSTAWVRSRLYVGSIKTTDIVLDSVCYSDNLPEPVKKKLLIKSEVESRNASLDDIEELDKERIRNSKWFKDYMKENELNEE